MLLSIMLYFVNTMLVLDEIELYEKVKVLVNLCILTQTDAPNILIKGRSIHSGNRKTMVKGKLPTHNITKTITGKAVMN